MKILETLRKESTWAAAIIIFAAIMIYVRSANHICIGDELRYYYKFELKPGQNYFNFNNLQPVKTTADVVESQVNHYMCVNGRIPVHFAEQMIAAKRGLSIFYILNAIAFAAAILLFLRLTLPPPKQEYAMAALIAVIAFLYLFPSPGRLWTSINLSLNYLWPSLASLALLLELGKSQSGEPIKLTFLRSAGLCILGLLTGWSNEAFAFPLSGAIFLYFVLNIKRFNKPARLLVIPLWIGSAIMLASPGNWIRATQATETLSSFIDVLLSLKLLWMLIITGLICICAATKATIRFCKQNYVILTALLLSLAMGVIAHTAPRAFTAIELFSAILLGRAAAPLVRPAKGAILSVIATLACLMAIHQAFATAEHIRQYRTIRDALTAYRTSKTGTVRYNYSESPAWLKPFVYSQVPTLKGADYEWRLLGISRCGTRKPFTALTEEQFTKIDSIKGPSPSSSPLYPFTRIGNGYVTPSDPSIQAKYKVKTQDGRELTVARRKFISPAGRVFAALIPPSEETFFVKINPETKSSDQDKK